MTQASPNADRAALSRRNFLQLTATGLAGAAGYTLLGSRSSAAPARGGSSAAPAWGRQPGGHRPSGAASNVTSLDGGWLFGGLFVAGSDQSTFDDRAFLDVTLPHCVTPLAWREWDTATWEQQWIYRRHFDLPRGADQMRTFLDFAGVLTGATPTLNGKQLPEHLGGYLPFSYEITDGVSTTDNVLAVEVDSRWLYVPPEGSPAGPKAVDYLEPGGISRGVALRVVPQVFLADVFAKPVGVLEPSPSVQVSCTVDAAVVPPGPVEVVVELLDGDRTRSRASTTTTITSPGQTTVSLQLDAGQGIGRWSPDNPKLYEVLTTLSINGRPIHDFTRTIGFRDAVFDVDGFFLNGQRLKIFGLDRHQIFPYAGMSIPARVQRRDALILKQQLNCNMVRCSHYPQSSHFLDACDELGIMVWEETPGWQFIGDATWQAEVVSNVHDMVIRDRNRPSIVLWGVQVNESPREPQLYTQTRDLANSLDGSRQTSGTETSQSLTGWVQEVFAYDDYNSSNGNATLLPPIPGVPYLVTEAVGALDGPPYYRWIDDQPTQADQAKLHAQVHDIAASADAYSGLLAWCGFDYDSDNGNIYQNIKWPGVADTFRVLKPGAAFYQAQVDPRSGPVIQPAFYWDFGPTSPVTSLGSTAAIWSNCDQLEAYSRRPPLRHPHPGHGGISPHGPPAVLPRHHRHRGVHHAGAPPRRLRRRAQDRLPILLGKHRRGPSADHAQRRQARRRRDRRHVGDLPGRRPLRRPPALRRRRRPHRCAGPGHLGRPDARPGRDGEPGAGHPRPGGHGDGDVDQRRVPLRGQRGSRRGPHPHHRRPSRRHRRGGEPSHIGLAEGPHHRPPDRGPLPGAGPGRHRSPRRPAPLDGRHRGPERTGRLDRRCHLPHDVRGNRSGGLGELHVAGDRRRPVVRRRCRRAPGWRPDARRGSTQLGGHRRAHQRCPHLGPGL